MGLWGWITEKANEVVTAVTNLATGDTAAWPAQTDNATEEGVADGAFLSSPQSREAALVRYQEGAMFVDSDGDLAHEFYEEDEQGGMRRKTTGLAAQGPVRLPIPRIRCDLPILLCPASGPTVAPSLTPQR